MGSVDAPAPWVPIIDLAWPEQQAAETIRRACQTSGFFYLTGHGLDDIIEKQFAQSAAFFSQPLEVKQEIAIENTRFHRGYTSYSYETLDPSLQKAPDTKEGLFFGREVAEDSVEATKPLHGPNQWPDPARLPEFRPAMSAAFDGFWALGQRALRLVALAADLPPTWFLERFQRPLLNMRPLHYSASLSKPDEGLLGCGAHTDFGVVSLLAVDGVPGFQIFRDGGWVDVDPVPGTVLVNLGDMLERWTSGRFKSTMHRVNSRSGKERYSTAFFMEPSFEEVVDPRDIPSCCPPGQEPLYPPITSGEWVLAKYDAIHVDPSKYRTVPPIAAAS